MCLSPFVTQPCGENNRPCHPGIFPLGTQATIIAQNRPGRGQVRRTRLFCQLTTRNSLSRFGLVSRHPALNKLIVNRLHAAAHSLSEVHFFRMSGARIPPNRAFFSRTRIPMPSESAPVLISRRHQVLRSLGGPKSALPAVLCGVAVSVLLGCGQSDEIVRYTVQKPEEVHDLNQVERATKPDSSPQPQQPQEPQQEREAPLKYEVPDGWTATGGTGFSMAAFEVSDQDKTVRITVTPAGGDLLANVNRWCTQIGRAELTPEELDRTARKIPLGGNEGTLVELIGPKEAILGVIGDANDRTWFIKLKGDANLAQREKERFEQFVQSIEF